MELQELKNLLNAEKNPQKDRAEIRALLNTKPHPVLRNVRRQVIIEATAWGAFLLLAYTAFDADTKPLWVGLMVMVPVSIYLFHLVAGYARIISAPADGPLMESLASSYQRMQRFAVGNLLLRSLVLACVLLFFSYGITFTPVKYWTLGGIGAFFAIQLLLNRNLWFRRLRRLRDTITRLEG